MKEWLILSRILSFVIMRNQHPISVTIPPWHWDITAPSLFLYSGGWMQWCSTFPRFSRKWDDGRQAWGNSRKLFIGRNNFYPISAVLLLPVHTCRALCSSFLPLVELNTSFITYATHRNPKHIIELYRSLPGVDTYHFFTNWCSTTPPCPHTTSIWLRPGSCLAHSWLHQPHVGQWCRQQVARVF